MLNCLLRNVVGALAGAFLCFAALYPLADARAADVTVYAAASLKNALDEIAAAWTEKTGHAARLSYAGSSALARQIERGAPADLFISANRDWMDALEAKGLIDSASRFDLAANEIVLIAHDSDAPPLTLTAGMDLAGTIGQGRLAMALVEAVPAGIYGKAALESLGVWQSVAPKVAQTDNVRAALALVATGAAPFGIVYATDAAVEDRVTVVARFPDTSHPPVVYPVAVLQGRGEAAVLSFIAFLHGPKARAILVRQGFRPLPE